ncbi:Protein kinase domain-containing protein [Psidium guajava]|nr:Protein kinase domain-containing protein [Psidium guajava]
MEMIGKSGFLGPFLIALAWRLVLVDSACNTTTTTAADHDLVSRAFASVSGFHPSLLRSGPNSTCSSSLAEIRLPSRNLSGIVAWKHLKAVKGLRAIDLSGNSLQGSVPGWFISAATGLVELNLSSNRFGGGIAFASTPRNVSSSSSSLRVLNLSGNRFTNLGNFSGFFSRLRVLDLSGNELRAFPLGLSELAALERLDVSGCNISGDPRPVSSLKSLNYLDISNNKLTGVFPNDFPPLAGLAFLNISLNDFAGRVGRQTRRKFGDSAFLHAGKNLVLETDAPKTPSPATRNRNSTSPARETIKKRAASKRPKSRKRKLVLILAPITASLVAAAFAALCCVYSRRRTLARRKNKWAISGPARPEFRMERASGPFAFETESGTAWVADIKEPSSAAVVMFEKPLMSLTFRDLIAATSGFGRESLLGEGRCGPVYRAVLPGDLHVAIRVLDGARAVDHGDAARVFEGLAKLKHPNLLPISGYCIAGKEKLVLCEFMPNGDLRQWLHELPAGAPDVEDWSTDTWEHPGGEPSSPEKANWLTRHRFAVGVARGLAYLHHAGSAHGHLVASNVLLADDLEPRISDFGIQDFGRGKEQFRDGRIEHAGPAPERDVYFFGMILVELLTGREGGEESLAWARRLVREGRGEEALERRLRIGGGDSVVSEMVQCLRVGYLCTAESPGKRPTMQQVVGLLKDIRPQPS